MNDTVILQGVDWTTSSTACEADCVRYARFAATRLQYLTYLVLSIPTWYLPGIYYTLFICTYYLSQVPTGSI